MNFELFKKWFTEMLIPNIPENSLIIMDNASYHNRLADHSPPTAKSYGHEVIRTPPYHPELQPIETCWGVVENHIARNCDFTVKNLIEQLSHSFDKVTSVTCKKIIAKVRAHEDTFWTEDGQDDLYGAP